MIATWLLRISVQSPQYQTNWSLRSVYVTLNLNRALLKLMKRRDVAESGECPHLLVHILQPRKGTF